jgi:hypothetical protein
MGCVILIYFHSDLKMGHSTLLNDLSSSQMYRTGRTSAVENLGEKHFGRAYCECPAGDHLYYFDVVCKLESVMRCLG